MIGLFLPLGAQKPLQLKAIGVYIASIAGLVNPIWCAIGGTQWQSVYFAIRFD